MNLKKLISLILLALVILTGGLSLATSNTSEDSESAVYPVLAGQLEPAGVPADGANVVDIGMYGTNVYELSFEDYTFYFTGYIWLRWEGDLDPVSSLEFVNAVETWGLMVTPLTEEPEQLATGEYVQTLSVQGRFYKAFQLKDYPLDSQSLSIMIEDTTNTADKIQYRADATQTGLDPNFKVQGFEVNGVSAQNYLHSYGTDFGYTGTSAKQTYSTLEFQIQIDRNSNLFVWKLMLPLLLVLITNWLTLLMNPKYVEVRTAMPATALLTTVFLQLSAMESVSQSSVLVLMDQIYLVAYASIVFTLGRVIWDNHKVKNEEDDEHIAVVAQKDRVTLILQAAITTGILIVLVLPKLL